jgi:hypothetical protein
MRIPTRDRTRRAGLALAAALLIALPALAAPTSPSPAADAGAEVTAAGWVDGFAALWQRLLAAAAGVPAGDPQEPIEPQQGDDDATLLRAYDDKGENGPSLDPNGRF